MLNFKTTKEIEISPKIIDQIIGQDEAVKLIKKAAKQRRNIFFFILLIISVITPWWIRSVYGDIMAAASLIGSMIFLASFVIFINLSRRIKTNEMQIPKLLVDNSIKDKNLFIDATGAHDGALLGDVLHDPLQSFVTNKLQQIIEIGNKENKF